MTSCPLIPPNCDCYDRTALCGEEMTETKPNWGSLTLLQLGWDRLLWRSAPVYKIIPESRSAEPARSWHLKSHLTSALNVLPSVEAFWAEQTDRW